MIGTSNNCNRSASIRKRRHCSIGWKPTKKLATKKRRKLRTTIHWKGHAKSCPFFLENVQHSVEGSAYETFNVTPRDPPASLGMTSPSSLIPASKNEFSLTDSSIKRWAFH